MGFTGHFSAYRRIPHQYPANAWRGVKQAFDMAKRNRHKTMPQVIKEIRRVYRENGKSWTKAARHIGVSRGTLIRVSKGYEPKEKHIRQQLGLTVFAVVIACEKCGQAHVSKRCTKRKTFEDNCREYDAWLANPKTQQQLQKMLEWAETPIEHRQKYTL
jgi:DNA-binding XRE family transcriptional regulator